MQDLQKRIAEERSRLKAVRQLLSAALELGGERNAAWVAFYIAVGEYMQAAMHRLHLQDLRMTALLEAKADLSTPDAQQAMTELAERLEGNQQHLQRYLAAKQGLIDEGVSGLDEYESAALAYTQYIVTNMGHHPGTVNLAQAAFLPEDWENMAFVSNADAQREQKLYKEVRSRLPGGLQIPAE